MAKSLRITFVHPSFDVRGIGVNDFTAAGLPASPALVFYKGQPVEVEEKVARTLLDHPNFAGEFELAEPPA
jgi:hypothetical protein